MKIHFLLALAFISFRLFAANVTLMVDTNGVLNAPTNFFRANTNNISAGMSGSTITNLGIYGGKLWGTMAITNGSLTFDGIPGGGGGTWPRSFSLQNFDTVQNSQANHVAWYGVKDASLSGGNLYLTTYTNLYFNTPEIASFSLSTNAVPVLSDPVTGQVKFVPLESLQLGTTVVSGKIIGKHSTTKAIVSGTVDVTDVASATSTYTAMTNAVYTQGWLNAKNPPFNAVGDGVTDDTAALTRIFQARNKIVYIPPGNYLISSTIQAYPSVTVIGDQTYNDYNINTNSLGRVRIFSSSTGAYTSRWPMFVYDGTNGAAYSMPVFFTGTAQGLAVTNYYYSASVSGITFDGGLGTASDAILANNVAELKVEGCNFVQFVRSALNFFDVSSSIVRNNNVSIVNGSPVTWSFGSDNMVYGNRISGGYGPAFWAIGFNKNQVFDNHLFNQHDPAATAYGRISATKSGNTFVATNHRLNTGDLCSFEATSGSPAGNVYDLYWYYAIRVDDNTIKVTNTRGDTTGLTLSGSLTGTQYLHPYGPNANVSYNDTVDGLLSGNIIDQAFGDDVRFVNCSAFAFHNNLVTEAGYANASAVANNVSHLLLQDAVQSDLSGNVIKKRNTTSASVIGIRGLGTSTSNNVANVFDDLITTQLTTVNTLANSRWNTLMDFAGNATVPGTLAVTGTSSTTGITNTGTLGNSGATYLASTLTGVGSAVFGSTVQVTNTLSALAGLNVTGTSALAAATFSGTSTFNGVPTIKPYSSTAGWVWSASDNSVTVTPKAAVFGAMTFNTEGNSQTLELNEYSDTLGHGIVIETIRGGGTVAAKTKVLSGAELFRLKMGGLYDSSSGTKYGSAEIHATATEDWTSTSNGSLIALKTTVAGGTTTADRMKVSNLGVIVDPAGSGAASLSGGSIFDIVSTAGGFRPPKMTTTQKNNISGPTAGLIVYDSTLNKLCVYTGAAWETITSL